jgi:hypothetical protein
VLVERVGFGYTGGTGRGEYWSERLSNFLVIPWEMPRCPHGRLGRLLPSVPRAGPGFFGIREVMGAITGSCGNSRPVCSEAAVVGNVGDQARFDSTPPRVVNTLRKRSSAANFQNDSPYALDTDRGEQPIPINNIALSSLPVRYRIPPTGRWTFGYEQRCLWLSV